MELSFDHYLKFFVIVNLRKQILKMIMRNTSMFSYKVFIMLTPFMKTVVSLGIKTKRKIK